MNNHEKGPLGAVTPKGPEIDTLGASVGIDKVGGLDAVCKDGLGLMTAKPLSNSGFCGFFGGMTPISGRLSLDKISFVIPMPWRGSDSAYTQEMWSLLDRKLDRGMTRDHNGSVLYKYHITYRDKFDVQFGTKSGSSKESLRIEHNPNESDIRDLTKILGPLSGSTSAHKIKLASVTRMDWAIDYPCRVYPEFFRCTGVTKGRPILGKRGIETYYMGAKTSDIQIRIYDKALQLRQIKHADTEGELWRVELQDRRKGCFGPSPDQVATLSRNGIELPRGCASWGRSGAINPFDRLTYYDAIPSSGGWPMMAPHIMGSQLGPAVGMQGVRSYVVDTFGRACWRKHFEPYLEAGHTIVQPSVIFAEQAASVWADYENALWESVDESAA